jgi:hypothetical protein
LIQSLAAPGLLSRAEFLALQRDGTWDAEGLIDKIHGASRSYRRDHVAVLIDSDSAEDFIRKSGLQFDFLDPEANLHWTGSQRKKHLKPVLVGDYGEWFRWFMRWQRFNAFQIVVLVVLVRRLVDDERRGYLDGLLTRLLNRTSIHRIIVVEEERFQPIIRSWLLGGDPVQEVRELKGKFGQAQFKQAVVSLLYGTHLSAGELRRASGCTLFSRLTRTGRRSSRTSRGSPHSPRGCLAKSSRPATTAGRWSRAYGDARGPGDVREP